MSDTSLVLNGKAIEFVYVWVVIALQGIYGHSKTIIVQNQLDRTSAYLFLWEEQYVSSIFRPTQSDTEYISLAAEIEP